MIASTAVRYTWLDPWLGVRDGPFRELCKAVGADLASHEKAMGCRLRRRRPIDQIHHEAALATVLANLAYATLVPPVGGRLGLLTGNSDKGFSRYSNRAFGKPFRRLLHHLKQLRLIDLISSTERGQASSVAPSDAFRSALNPVAIDLSDFRRLEGEEVIILSRNTHQGAGRNRTVTREYVDYEETAATRGLRESIQRINRFLEAADIAFVDDGLGLVDPYQRRLTRHFVMREEDLEPCFDQGGRLFGGFWMNLKSSRRAAIRINGEPVGNLDFSSLFPRLAYASIGVSPPVSDLYAIPGLEGYRNEVKSVLNCLLFDHFRRRTWPEGIDGLPREWTVSRTKAAIVRHHPELRGCLGQGLGLSFMYTESVILVQVLHELIDQGIVGLGLHDGLLVPRSKIERTKMIMERVAHEVASVPLPVSIKA
ncbi:hypothetical protein [Chelatococcus asaccharovorans]|uniref:Uncharacterized protein n=1 Tax=Chelatococcus asaccharovorans TaxID=28210 RepID=A0A2V3TVY3_9HYPH|nr:hypothetical protein [Chelatococcus asaccharovorans]MBS7705192.1 hypothetical protein [Chelatococcus asaccharovorans]PXW53689.1 hypothetical protein C7450_113177 [Chelatococcus asaccharovorans]